MSKRSTLFLSALGIIAAAVGLLYLLNITSPASEGDGRDEAAARVNGEAITRGELEDLESRMAADQGTDIEMLDAAASAEIQERALDALISRELLRQATAQAGVTADQEEVDEQLAALRAQFESDEAYAEALAAEGLTQEELRAQLSNDLAQEAFLNERLELSSLSASEEEVMAEYETARAQNEELPPLEEIRDQVEQYIVAQKEQDAIVQFIEELRAEAEVEILV